MKKKFALLPILVLMMTMIWGVCVWAGDTLTLTMREPDPAKTYNELFKEIPYSLSSDGSTGTTPSSYYSSGVSNCFFVDHDANGGNKFTMDSVHSLAIYMDKGNTAFANVTNVVLAGDKDYYEVVDVDKPTADAGCMIIIKFYVKSVDEIYFRGWRAPYIGETAEEYLNFIDSIVVGNDNIPLSLDFDNSKMINVSDSNSEMNSNDVFSEGKNYKLDFTVKSNSVHKVSRTSDGTLSGFIDGLGMAGVVARVSDDYSKISCVSVNFEPIVRPACETQTTTESNENKASANVDTYKSEAPANTFLSYNPDGTPSDMKVHAVKDATTQNNQSFLVKYYLGKGAKELATVNIYAPYGGAGKDNGQKRSFVWTDLSKRGTPGQPIDAIVYNQTDGAYVIHGIFTDNGTAVLDNFI